jgi:hypothetical protein
MKIVRATHVQALAVKRRRVIFPADESPNLNDPREVRCEERTDGATSNDANTLHIRAPLHSFTCRYAPFSILTNFSAW